MEVLHFSLGMLTVVLIYAVVGVFRLRKLFKRSSVRKRKAINNLESLTKDLSRQLNEEINAVYREMDIRINAHAVQPLRETNENVAREVEDIYRMVDSRLDKLENRLTQNS